MTCVFLDRHDAELESAWGWLRARWGDVSEEHEGERWQYMGTELRADGWEHVFRHRCHPSTGERVYWRCAASSAWVKRDARGGLN